MYYSDSSSKDTRNRNKKKNHHESSDDYDSRRPPSRKLYENRRVAPKQRGNDRIKTQLDDLGEIERVFNYDTEESSDNGKYGNIKIINMPYDGRRGNRKGYRENDEYDQSMDIEASEDVPLIEVSKPVDPNRQMLAQKPPPKIVVFKNKINELSRFIQPYGYFWTLWTFLIILLCIYELLMVPFVVAFKFLGNGGLWAFDYIVDFLFLVDIALLFFVARAPKTYYLITDKTRIQLYYAWGWFMVDFIASFPMDVFVWIAFGVRDRNYTRFLKVFHFFRLYRAIHQLVKKGREKENLTSEKWILLNPNIERFASILIFFYLVIHYGACLWITMGNVVGFGSTAFLPPLSLSGAGFGSQYLNALHWSFYSIVGPFSLLHRPTSIGETFFSALLGIFGLVFFIGLIAILANLLRTVDEHNSQWQRNQMDINVSHKKKIAQEWLLIQLASEKLFEGVGFDVLNALAARCKFKSFPPNVNLVREGIRPGPYLYFLKRGIVQESKEGKHIAYLGTGSSFNQLGFLSPRSDAEHTLHTVKYTELFVLRKSDLIRVAQTYPAFNEHLVSKMSQN